MSSFCHRWKSSLSYRLLYGCHDYLLDSLQLTMNNAARMISRIPKSAHITPYLAALHWLPVTSRIEYKLASLSFQCMNGNAPNYLKELISQKQYSRYSTRSSSDSSALKEAPASSQKTLGDRCFSRAAPSVWNSIPTHVRSTENLSSFKSALKSHLFRKTY